MSGIKKVVSCVLGFVLVLASVSGFAKESIYNLPQGVTQISQDIYRMHMIMMYICAVIGILVFAVLIYCCITFRHSKGAKSHGANHHIWVEVVWTLIPFLILVVMAVPATTVLMKMHDDSRPALNIKITGYQWYWRYEYLDQGISFYSRLSTPQAQIDGTEKKDQWYLLEVDHPMVVPIHAKIRLLVTSNDVIHSWWVPELGVKQDAVPGYVNETWTEIEKPGTYRGQCGELCGTFHGFMPIVVKAVTQPEFEMWVKQQTHAVSTTATKATVTKNMPLAQLMDLGKKGYGQYCAACHQSTGLGLPPSFPAIKGGKIATGPVDQHIELVLNGVSGTAMQAFGAQLDDATIAAIITYQRNAWGNNALSKVKIVEPSDVAKLRKRGAA